MTAPNPSIPTNAAPTMRQILEPIYQIYHSMGWSPDFHRLLPIRAGLALHARQQAQHLCRCGSVVGTVQHAVVLQVAELPPVQIGLAKIPDEVTKPEAFLLRIGTVQAVRFSQAYQKINPRNRRLLRSRF